MSTGQSTPRWRSLLEAAISRYPNQTVIQIATIASAPSPKPQPKVRSHIFRSFLPNDEVGTPSPNLPLLISTTDIRTPKVSQITNNSNVEVVWWNEGTKQQWRLTGKAFLVASPDLYTGNHLDEFYRTLRASFDLPREEAQPYLGVRSAAQSVGNPQTFWENQRQATFRTMSAHMKASWVRPVPGTSLRDAGGPDAAKKWPVRIDEPRPEDPQGSPARKLWNEALRNFALLIIEPIEVDFVDLAEQPNRRFRFERIEAGQWAEEELVP